MKLKMKKHLHWTLLMGVLWGWIFSIVIKGSLLGNSMGYLTGDLVFCAIVILVGVWVLSEKKRRIWWIFLTPLSVLFLKNLSEEVT